MKQEIKCLGPVCELSYFSEPIPKNMNTNLPLNRRTLLQGALASAVSLPLLEKLASAEDAVPLSPTPGGPNLKATIGEGIIYKDLVGDTWNPTWADDDNLYTGAGDTLGTGARPISSNVGLYQISGTPPDIKVEVVNAMPQYGKYVEIDSKDACTWKPSGMFCLDGILYLAASRNRYGNGKPEQFNIQQVWDASIIKSTDHGKTWSTVPPMDQAMFPGHTFSNPSFVQYGKNGAAGPHGSDKYVYAVSNDGTWNNGNSMVLGRVPREKLANLDAKDWEFVQRLDGQYNPTWGPRHDTAIYILRAPGCCGEAGVQYLPGLDVYVLPQWHYPTLNDTPQAEGWDHTRFELYQARAPWGPWHLFHTQDFKPEGYYNPSIPSKFVSADGKSFWIIVAGNFNASPRPYYTINMLPVKLEAV